MTDCNLPRWCRWAPRIARLFGIAAAVVACGGPNQQTATDAVQQSLAFTQQRLNGTWVLRQFVPEVPLEGSLQTLLHLQFGRLTLTLSGNTLRARGPGVDTERRIQVRSAFGDHFDAVVYDQFGVGYETSNDFQGDTLVVQIVTLPWRGQAVLVRSGQRPLP